MKSNFLCFEWMGCSGVQRCFKSSFPEARNEGISQKTRHMCLGRWTSCKLPTLLRLESRGAGPLPSRKDQDFTDEATLEKLLMQSGCSVELYGKGKAKSISALAREVQAGESVLQWCEKSYSLQRVVEPVFVRLLWEDRVLVEVEQRFPDGRRRQRNMLLAEKKGPADLDATMAAIRGTTEELQLPYQAVLRDNWLRSRPDSYWYMTEKLESASYPGLPCVYKTHYCCIEITDIGVQNMLLHGLLEDTFETQEADKVLSWKWMLQATARELKVKGFPP